MNYFIRLLIICTAISLTACASRSEPFTGRDKQYLAATSVPSLRIPPGIATSSFHNEYPVSDHYYPEKIKDVSLVPPGLYS